MAIRVLVVEDDTTCRKRLVAALGRLGLTVMEAGSVEDARPLLEDGAGILFLDLGLPGASGADFLPEVAQRHPDVPVVIVTADGRLEQAVEMMRRGAYDYIGKPVSNHRLEAVVTRAKGEALLRREVRYLRSERDRREGLKSVVGTSTPMRKVHEQIRQAAPSHITVTLVGESGTGKEVLARALHHESQRRDGPFVALRCSAVPVDLLESMLFGHRAGAFPGAVEAQRGHFLMADGGTLFLDEVGEMTPELQAKLLRALQEHTILPLGADKEVPTDVRILAATNRNLEHELAAGRIRQELFYRLVAFPIFVPPLRLRRDDIPELAYHFLQKHREDAGKQTVARIEEEVLERLKQHPWPGNVRQLENTIHHALLRTKPGCALSIGSLPDDLLLRSTPGTDKASAPAINGNGHAAAGGSPPTPSPFHDVETGRLLSLREIEDRAFRLALRECGGNTTQAARALGVARATFYRRLKPKRSA